MHSVGRSLSLGTYKTMETLSPIRGTVMLDIRRQLAARNAVEVHAFREITSDYQQCLSHLRELRVCACHLVVGRGDQLGTVYGFCFLYRLSPCCRYATLSWIKKQRSSGAKTWNCLMQPMKLDTASQTAKRQVDACHQGKTHTLKSATSGHHHTCMSWLQLHF